jgi:hypothetical protein
MLRMSLKIDLEEHYQEVYEEMNHIEYIKFAESKGLTFTHPALNSEEENERQSELLKKHEKELIEHLNHFEKEKVYQRLNELLNKLIEDN